MQERLDLGQISLVCVETRNFDLAHFALKKSLAQAKFKEALLLSSTPAPLEDGIQNILIPPIRNIEEYSEFMVRHLGNYVDADFILVVQWDSFILNAKTWDASFLQYDYIGAPWPHRNEPVGNGGFSLRSRRLVLALNEIDIPQIHPEDACICEYHRETLEQEHGIKFAPLDIASQFAFELSIPAHETFGFHGFFNFHKALSEQELLEYIDMSGDRTAGSLQGRRLIKNLYRDKKFAAAKCLIQNRMRKGTLKMKFDAIKLFFKTFLYQVAHQLRQTRDS